MTNKKADEQAMDSLHGQLAQVLTEAIKGHTDPETGLHIAPTPAMLSVARQFLKDNGIDAVAKKGSPLGELAGLPEFEDENVIPIYGAQR